MRSTRPTARPSTEDAPTEGGLVAGLVGRGIQGSRSPAMHMQEAEAQGLELDYRLLDLDARVSADATLQAVLTGAEEEGFAGVNVTYPFKQEVIPLLDELSADAERLGAVNTVLFRRGRRVGHNTDWSGFSEALQRGLPGCAKARVVQVGAGGAGAAVAYALLHDGVEQLTVFDADRSRATGLVAKLQALFSPDRVAVGEDIGHVAKAADGLVNATPLGMAKHPGMPVSADLLRPDLWVSDIVYVPIETQLLAVARRRGCRVLDGGGMAVFQAADAFRLFTGREPDPDRMRAAFLKDVGMVGE